ncbi:MAG: DUF2306 domain-containing protein [Acidobacteriota bacterium]
MTRTFKIIGWVLMATLATAVTLVSLRYFFFTPEKVTDANFSVHFSEHIFMFLTHVFGGTIALLLGPLQFWGKFRNRRLSAHRWLGRIYLMGILIGGSGGLYMAFVSYGGLPTHIGFGMLASLWLTTGFLAYRTIRRGDTQAHRIWMIRNYSLTFAAVTLRLWIPTFMALGFSFLETYTTVAWIAWVPNLLIAEIYINRRQPQSVKDLSMRIAKEPSVTVEI